MSDLQGLLRIGAPEKIAWLGVKTDNSRYKIKISPTEVRRTAKSRRRSDDGGLFTEFFDGRSASQRHASQ